MKKRERRPVPASFVPHPLGGVTHGAFSALIVDSAAEQVLEELQEKVPFIWDLDIMVVDLLCTSTAQHRLLYTHAMDVAMGHKEVPALPGRPRTGLEALSQNIWRDINSAAERALKCTDRLGLSPQSRAQLTAALGVTQHYALEAQAALVREGRVARDARLKAVGGE